MPERLLLPEILNAVSVVTGLSKADLTGKSRMKAITWPRQRAFYVARKLRPDLSLPMIGRAFGGRDHTTVLHGIRRVEGRLRHDPAERMAVDQILTACGPATAARAQDVIAACDVEAQQHLDRLRELETIRAGAVAMAALGPSNSPAGGLHG